MQINQRLNQDDIGIFTHRITIQEKTLVNKGRGRSIDDYTTYATLWASVKQTGGFTRKVNNAHIEYPSVVEFMIYYDSVLMQKPTNALRIIWNNRAFEKNLSMKLSDDQKWFITITAESKEYRSAQIG